MTSESSWSPAQGDPEGQHLVFGTKDGQVRVVQDVYGLLIDCLEKSNSICRLWPWQARSRPEDRLQYVPYSEILAVRYLPVRRYCAGLPGHLRKQHFLGIQVVQRTRGRPWQWSLQHMELSTDSQEVAKQWVQQIKQRLQEQSHRPRQLLVFVNPYGGRRKALHVWGSLSAPVLAAAGVQCQVIETMCQGHAESVIKQLSLQQLQQLDGIVAVGGDGMFSELLTGVLQHRHLDAALQLRLAHIPAGSTDAVACTLHGTRDPLTATLHIALGDCTPLDVARLVTLPQVASPAAALAVPSAVLGACGISAGSDTMLLEPLGPNAPGSCRSDGVYVQQAAKGCSPASNRHEKRHKQQQKQRSRHKQQQREFEPQLRHFVCVANYGFLGDVMEMSERLRWMGPVRYDVAGALRWLLLRGYKATVWYKPAQQPEQQQQEQQQQQQQQAAPLVGPSAISPFLHYPQPGLHVGAPAYQHQHAEQQQQHSSSHGSSRAGSSNGAGSHSSGGSSNRSSFELQDQHAWSSGRPSPEPQSGFSQGAVGGTLSPGLAGGLGRSNGHNTPAAPASVGSDASAMSNSLGAGVGQHPGRHPDKHVSFSPMVYATAGSVSSMASAASAAPAGLATRANSITSSSSSRCHSRCLLCGAAAMRRSNSRSLFVAESQQGQLAEAVSQPEAAAAAPAAIKNASIQGTPAVAASPPAHPTSTPAHPTGSKQAVALNPGQHWASQPPAAGASVAAEASSPPGPGWVKVEGTFASIMCVVTSCRSDKSKSGLMPEAHLSDGRLALVMVEKRSRLQYLRFLIQLARRGIMPGMLPFVRVEYVTDVQVQTEGKQSSWNADGELLKHSRVRFGVHAGLVDVFARGVEIM